MALLTANGAGRYGPASLPALLFYPAIARCSHLSESGMNLASLPLTVAAPLGYLLMGGLFVFAGVDHALRFAQVRGMLAGRGWPAPGALLAVASLLELAAGLGLALGIARARSALVLAAFTVVASFLLLGFWRFTGPERKGMRSGFLVNVGLVGGLILAFAVSQ